MKSRVLTMLLVLVLTPMTSPFAPSQTNNAAQRAHPDLTKQDWQGLSDLKPDTRIRVEFKTGTVIDTKFVGLNGSTMTLIADGESFSADQSDIQTVHRLNGRWSRLSTARIGAVIGLVAGSVIGGRGMARLERDPNRVHSDEDEAPLIAGIGFGTLGGAAAGALMGGRRRGKLLYEAK